MRKLLEAYLKRVEWDLSDVPFRLYPFVRGESDDAPRNIVIDPAIAFGVTGAPESFIVDKGGIVRYKHTGVITKRDWERTLWPIIQDLRKK